MEEGRAADLVYLSFKAFNTAPNNVLRRKLRKSGLDKWTGRWVENWLNCRSHSHKSVAQGPVGGLSMAVSPKVQWWAQSRLTFPSMTGMKGRGLLSNFTDNTKLGGVADSPEGCAALRKDLNRLERWAKRNLLKSSKGKCRILHLGRSNLRHQHRLGVTRWEAALWRRR
ncbi:hypothetical protein DUI87_22370 [Hirundo rustica rustica]|uniref:Reverse transcriptase domain-containing protein n=1 Tax=Hirundo rustica rustica TaxID=333673 RepID=A0A3M0JPX1_HIRRU|nr:hypothetical protein DUI87_22370 [Hirundo rustica rustica]